MFLLIYPDDFLFQKLDHKQEKVNLHCLGHRSRSMSFDRLPQIKALLRLIQCNQERAVTLEAVDLSVCLKEKLVSSFVIEFTENKE